MGTTSFRAAQALPGNPYDIVIEPIGEAVALKSRTGFLRAKSLCTGATGDDVGRVDEILAFFREDELPFTLICFDDDFRAGAWELLHRLGMLFTGVQTRLSASPRSNWPELPSDVEIAELGTEDLDSYLDLYYQAHGSAADQESETRPFERAELSMPGHHLYLLHVNGDPAAVAAMYVSGNIASSFNATVLFRFRRAATIRQVRLLRLCRARARQSPI